MAMTKILVADSMDKEALDEMRAVPGFDVSVKTGLNEADLIKAVPDYQAMVVRSATKVTRPVIEAARSLKLIVRAGIGLDNIDTAAAKEKGIAVANTPAATSISVAEHTFGLMLGVVRNHGKAVLTMKQHKWEKKALEGTELFGKTLGIIGCGRIGIEVARRAIAFGMKVLAYDVIPIKTDLAVKQVPLDELLAAADVVTVHVPKLAKPVLGEDEFRKMKDGVIVINVARGGVVDEKALLNGLTSGKVRAAALDVYDKEPPVDFSLIDHPNVTPIPHLGASAVEGQRRAGLEVVRILREKLGSSPA
jgi:D-3-phosphoglycerate dehydrogenase